MSENSPGILDRGSTAFTQLEPGFRKFAAGSIGAFRLLEPDSNGKAVQAGAGSTKVIGASKHPMTRSAGEEVEFGYGPTLVVADRPITPGQRLKAGDGGRVLPLVDSTLAGTSLHTSSAGLAFTNQPTNDGIEVVSNNAADTTQTVTITGTTQGTDTVVVETVTLNGTTPVSTVKTDWGIVLGVELSAAAAGTVTIREASADQTIVSFTAGQTSKGVETISEESYNVAPVVVASGSTTKQIGLAGTNAAGSTIYDSQALNGTTDVAMNSPFRTLTKLFTGDLEATRTITLKVGAQESEALYVGKAFGPASAQGDYLMANIA